MSPKRFDEAIYTPVAFSPLSHDLLMDMEPNNHLGGGSSSREGSIDNFDSFMSQNVDFTGKTLPPDIPPASIAKRIAPIGELFFFDYGVVVMWGLTQEEEVSILELIRPCEEDKYGK